MGNTMTGGRQNTSDDDDDDDDDDVNAKRVTCNSLNLYCI